jgi:RHS repeat-associated protein
MTAESGTGDGTASRSLSYDLAGLLVGVDHPSGTIGYTYDDRGLLTDVSGPGGTATYTYDDAGRMTQRVDAAGTTSFTWTPRFELDTVTDPATGTILDYTWDAASELTGVDYGTSGAVRTYSYDGQGRLKTDTLVDDTSTTVVSDVYGYDSDSNLTSKTIVLPGNGAAGSHSYTYDYADRLASWTDPSSTTVDYTWDLAGNRVGAGSDTFTYDQRNRLTSGPEGDYTYTARGTLDTIDTTRVYGYDPLGRLTSAEGVTYGYDGLDRVATRRSDTFEYSDTGYDPTTDANQTYTRTPGGHLLSITDGTSNLLAGVDRHGDLTHLYQADGTITDTVSYNPFGDPTDTTGSFAPTVGFQSDWTDPTTTHVWQGARWYQPAWAGFLSRDTIRGELSTPVSLNRYTYANNNPLNYWDPYGQQPIDLTYGGQNCEINYACAPTPAQATTNQPARPKTSSDGSDEVAQINAERSTADTYGLTSGTGLHDSGFQYSLTSGPSNTTSVDRIGGGGWRDPETKPGGKSAYVEVGACLLICGGVAIQDDEFSFVLGGWGIGGLSAEFGFRSATPKEMRVTHSDIALMKDGNESLTIEVSPGGVGGYIEGGPRSTHSAEAASWWWGAGLTFGDPGIQIGPSLSWSP